MNEAQSLIFKRAMAHYNLDEAEGSVRFSSNGERHKTIGRLLKIISELDEQINNRDAWIIGAVGAAMDNAERKNKSIETIEDRLNRVKTLANYLETWTIELNKALRSENE